MAFDAAEDRDAGGDAGQKVRLQRYLADAGVAARRVCEAMIEQGRVQVNGTTQMRLPVFVDPLNDRVTVDGRLVAKPAAALTLVVHKPQRVLVTASDEPGMERATILDIVDHPARARLFPVGRLGWDDSGLVVLTNDGELANALTHPRYGVPKRYEVLVAGEVGEEELAKIRRSAKLVAKASAFAKRREQQAEQGEGPLARRSKARGEIEVVVLDREAGKTVLGIAMSDAKGKPLRDILHGAGLPVRKITRVAIGPLTLRGLKVAAWREVSREELRVLRAIVEDGRYDEQRAMKLMTRGEGHGGGQGGSQGWGQPKAFWPAPVLRQEAMKQQRLGQQRAARKPRTIPDALLAERQEGERARAKAERDGGQRGGGPGSGRERSGGARGDGARPVGPNSDRPRSDRPRQFGARPEQPPRERPAFGGPVQGGGKPAGGPKKPRPGEGGAYSKGASAKRAGMNARGKADVKGGATPKQTPMEEGGLIRRRPKPPTE
jgi:23S rRNA pseudouridine2605 synthase